MVTLFGSVKQRSPNYLGALIIAVVHKTITFQVSARTPIYAKGKLNCGGSNWVTNRISGASSYKRLNQRAVVVIQRPWFIWSRRHLANVSPQRICTVSLKYTFTINTCAHLYLHCIDTQRGRVYYQFQMDGHWQTSGAVFISGLVGTRSFS